MTLTMNTNTQTVDQQCASLAEKARHDAMSAQRARDNRWPKYCRTEFEERVIEKATRLIALRTNEAREQAALDAWEASAEFVEFCAANTKIAGGAL
jgi:hypothetical protein